MLLFKERDMLTPEQRQTYIQTIADLPGNLENAIASLTETQLTTPYLSDEWSVVQNVHHMADSHMNSFIRLKMILTEDHPALKPYNQDAWVKMVDEVSLELENSLSILRGLHRRWVMVFKNLSDADWQRTGHHPEVGTVTVDDMLDTYAAHCRDHLDQIQRTLAAAGN
ncbi:MAG: YfiT family bacillithiol transferase [Chloroflexota bacterium]